MIQTDSSFLALSAIRNKCAFTPRKISDCSDLTITPNQTIQYRDRFDSNETIISRFDQFNNLSPKTFRPHQILIPIPIKAQRTANYSMEIESKSEISSPLQNLSGAVYPGHSLLESHLNQRKKFEITFQKLKIQSCESNEIQFINGCEEVRKQILKQYESQKQLISNFIWQMQSHLDNREFQLAEMGGFMKKLIRKAKILRYQQKKKNRRFREAHRYEVRQVIANKRIRIKGRFVSKEQQEEILKEFAI